MFHFRFIFWFQNLLINQDARWRRCTFSCAPVILPGTILNGWLTLKRLRYNFIFVVKQMLIWKNWNRDLMRSLDLEHWSVWLRILLAVELKYEIDNFEMFTTFFLKRKNVHSCLLIVQVVRQTTRSKPISLFITMNNKKNTSNIYNRVDRL